MVRVDVSRAQSSPSAASSQGYMMSFYAISFAWPLSLVGYVLCGFFADTLPIGKLYLSTFEIYCARPARSSRV